MYATTVFIAALFTLFALPLRAAEAEALNISTTIQLRHLPFGGILDPIFAAPGSDFIIGYTRCGDSAIWLGEIELQLQPAGTLSFSSESEEAHDELAN